MWKETSEGGRVDKKGCEGLTWVIYNDKHVWKFHKETFFCRKTQKKKKFAHSRATLHNTCAHLVHMRFSGTQSWCALFVARAERSHTFHGTVYYEALETSWLEDALLSVISQCFV